MIISRRQKLSKRTLRQSPPKNSKKRNHTKARKQTEINTHENYLTHTIIFSDNSTNLSNQNDTIKKIVMSQSFGTSDFFNKMRDEIKRVLPDKHGWTDDWVACINKCYTTTHDFVSRELNSTAYYLRIIPLSTIGDTQGNKFAFKISDTDIKKITGVWENDYKYFRLIIINTSSTSYTEARQTLNTAETATNKVNGKLIMGYGPSASGKTFFARKIIELMRIINIAYPTFFLSIDGGIYRDQSLAYQTIINLVRRKSQYSGLSNLVSGSFFSVSKGIFNSKIVKDNIKKYLLFQKNTHDFWANLYVPETAGSCIKYINCDKSFKDYVNITGDTDWVGLLIYQHKTQTECPYPNKYKCSGTIQSGSTREILEGKKYSSSAWANSMRNGEYMIGKALTYRFKIHNSGSPNRVSLFQDFSPRQLDISNNQKLARFLKKIGLEYQQH